MRLTTRVIGGEGRLVIQFRSGLVGRNVIFPSYLFFGLHLLSLIWCLSKMKIAKWVEGKKTINFLSGANHGGKLPWTACLLQNAYTEFSSLTSVSFSERTVHWLWYKSELTVWNSWSSPWPGHDLSKLFLVEQCRFDMHCVIPWYWYDKPKVPPLAFFWCFHDEIILHFSACAHQQIDSLQFLSSITKNKPWWRYMSPN